MTRPDREDLARQQDAVTEARDDMGQACKALAAEARMVYKILDSRSKIASPHALTDLTTALAGAMSAVRRAEDTLNVALVDLATARGEDL